MITTTITDEKVNGKQNPEKTFCFSGDIKDVRIALSALSVIFGHRSIMEISDEEIDEAFTVASEDVKRARRERRNVDGRTSL